MTGTSSAQKLTGPSAWREEIREGENSFPETFSIYDEKNQNARAAESCHQFPHIEFTVFYIFFGSGFRTNLLKIPLGLLMHVIAPLQSYQKKFTSVKRLNIDKMVKSFDTFSTSYNPASINLYFSPERILTPLDI